MIMKKKHPKADLRKHHLLFVETGIIFSLLFMLLVVNMTIKKTNEPINRPDFGTKASITIDIPITPPDKIPPKPINPGVFIEEPNDTPIEDEIEFHDFDMFEIPELLPPLPNNKIHEEEPYEIVEVMPKMKGGLEKLYREIKYPELAVKQRTEGRVIVQFVVDEKGKVSNPQIIRGIGAGCDEEVLRVIKLMTFTPGIQNGRFVKVRMAQPVFFRLQH